MKRTENAAIGGKSFIFDADAYERLETYLSNFRTRLDKDQSPEVMEDIESRIAEIIIRETGSYYQTVTLAMVNSITDQLGMPDGKPEYNDVKSTKNNKKMETVKKLYLDQDDKKIGGVCSGLALFFGIDVTIIRIIMLVALLCGGCGFWVYLVIWIVAPKAMTPAQKCELRGWPVTAENMAKFTDSSL